MKRDLLPPLEKEQGHQGTAEYLLIPFYAAKVVEKYSIVNINVIQFC